MPGSAPAAPQAAARVAPKARVRPRHQIALAGFALLVALPTAATVGYVYGLAADQYASRVAFSVRGAETVAPTGLLGTLASSFGASAGPDAKIVYEFVRSQQMLEIALTALPLREIWNVPATDVVFRLGEDQPVEDVLDYWNWMTDVTFDAGDSLVSFEARAFDPESARAITELVLAESTRLVNALSRQAREDAISIAREVLTEAEDRLRDVRRRIRGFRDIEQDLDPSENARAALSLVAGLEVELARTRIDLESQLRLVGERSPRIQVLRQNILSLEKQIAEERSRLGTGAGAAQIADGRPLSALLAEYEELEVDREFAETAYVSALASYEQAQIEARRQMRYLAPYVAPTLSVEAQHPQRALISLGAFAILLAGWAAVTLVIYNIRDRR